MIWQESLPARLASNDRPGGYRRSRVPVLPDLERLTPCMPCHPHQFTKPSAASLGTTSALLREPAEQGAVVRREAACGIAADNLLTGVETSAVSQDPLSCRPARPTQALSDYAVLPISSRIWARYAGSVGTWHDVNVGRPLAAPLERCAQLLGVDLATIHELAAKVEPRPSPNAAVALTGLTRLTGTSSNCDGSRHHP